MSGGSRCNPWCNKSLRSQPILGRVKQTEKDLDMTETTISRLRVIRGLACGITAEPFVDTLLIWVTIKGHPHKLGVLAKLSLKLVWLLDKSSLKRRIISAAEAEVDSGWDNLLANLDHPPRLIGQRD